MQNPKIYIIAGEPSGDILAFRFMKAFLKLYPKACFYGVGGENMETLNFKSLFPIKDLAVMGIFEVIPSLFKILKRMKEVIRDIQKIKPDIIITVDSYSFSARIHQLIIKNHIAIRHVHLVAPMSWVWKKGRAKKLAHFMDYLFCILPFEVDLFQKYKMPCSYIGHPVVEIEKPKGDFFKKYGIPRNKKIVVLLPGSRKTEIKYLLPIFKEAAGNLYAKNKDFYFVIPTVKTVADKVQAYFKDSKLPMQIILGTENRYLAFSNAYGAISASGTVSLELAFFKVPHLIAYKLNAITGFLAKKVFTIKYVNLINILENKPIIPELLQDNCTAPFITKTFLNLVKHPQKTEGALKKLGVAKESPSMKMALKIKEFLNGK